MEDDQVTSLVFDARADFKTIIPQISGQAKDLFNTGDENKYLKSAEAVALKRRFEEH
jgi:hypothetical protein